MIQFPYLLICSFPIFLQFNFSKLCVSRNVSILCGLSNLLAYNSVLSSTYFINVIVLKWKSFHAVTCLKSSMPVSMFYEMFSGNITINALALQLYYFYSQTSSFIINHSFLFWVLHMVFTLPGVQASPNSMKTLHSLH